MGRRGFLVAGGVLLLVGLAAAGVGAFALLQGPTMPTVALAAPRFIDVTGESGIDHTYGGGYTTFIGGGVAVLDCDADGRPDLYVAGGDQPAALFRNRADGSGGPRFERVADGLPALEGVMGAYPLDIDADGHVDLAVLRVEGLQVLRGQGDCRFEDATGALGLAGISGWTTAFAATWEQPDGLPTLAVGRYLRLDQAGEPVYECDDNVLLRPDGSGGRYAAPEPLDPGYCSLSMLFSDWDGSGRRDLRVSNDRQYYDYVNGEEQLWRIERGLPPSRYTADDGWVQLQVWGMGIASRDLTGDGLPEVYLTSQGDNKLQTLTAGPAQPMYRDIALKRGVLGTRPVNGGDPLPSTAWHPQFEDVNNDGFVDLFVSKGNVAQQEGYATRDPSNLYLGQPDGTFVEQAAEAGIVEFDRGRGSALVDLDGDGLLDLVEVKLDAPVRVWRNVGAGSADAPAAMGHWLEVQLREPGANRDAIGAIVEVDVGGRIERREVAVGGGHASGQLGPLHVGLGPADRARVRVTWPDGTPGGWLETGGDRLVVVERGAGGSDSIRADTSAGG
jgi:hypothetical protein